MTESRQSSSRSRPRRFLISALIVSLCFGATHLLGWREYTSVLSGTASFGTLPRLAGAIYAVFYTLFVVYVPILLIAAILAKAWDVLRLRYSG